MQPFRVAIKQAHPSGADHNEEPSVRLGPIACSTCAALNGMAMALTRGESTAAMSLEGLEYAEQACEKRKEVVRILP